MDAHEAKVLERRVAEHAAQHLPALPSRRVVLAASGGADSTAMVALLCEGGIIDPASAVVAHFDHALRDAEASSRDLAAVRALCSRYGVSLETDVWTAPRRGEAAARVARYDFLREIASSVGARGVLTGHTSDDQVETVLMHAMRGAGLHGLAGMSPSAPLPLSRPPGARHADAEVWRPLLGVSREETRAYCAARSLAYEDDATNEDCRFMRNRIRLELLPLMESIAPDARASLLALSEDARSVSAMLDAIAALVILDDGEGLVASEVALARGALRCLPADAAPHAFRLALARLLGDARDFSRVHYATLGRAASAATGTMFELPRGVIATVDPDAIVLSVGAPGPAVLAPDFVAPIPYGGRAGTWKIDVHPESDDGRRGERGFGGTIISLPRDAVVRGRRPGDRVALRGGGHKKLQDLYVDAKVARRERDAAPVIACGGEVLWTPLVAGKIAAACGGAGHRVLAGRSDRPGV